MINQNSNQYIKATTLENDKKTFEEWLIKHKSFSEKAAKDCFYRCRRIEKEMGCNLNKSISTDKKFEKLIGDFQKLSQKIFTNKKSAYSFAATLRAAARKYALYKYPES